MHFIVNLYVMVLIVGGIIAVYRELRKDSKQNPLPAWDSKWIDFLFIIWWIFAAAILAQAISYKIVESTYAQQAPSGITALAMGSCSHIASLLAIYYCYQFFKIGDKIQINPQKHSLKTWLGYVLQFLLCSVLLTIIVGNLWEFALKYLHHIGLAPIYHAQDLVNVFQDSSHIGTNIALILMAVVLAPISEELLFRMLIYRFLKGRWGARAALILSSLLFAFMHFNILSFLPLFLLGMLLCRAYEKSENIYVSMAFHALFNANNILLLFMQTRI